MLIGDCTCTPRRLAEISLLIGGQPAPLYRRHDGTVFAAASPGQRCVLKVRNLTSERIEVITTVDGRNTLKDEPGDARGCRGLVIDGYLTAEFAGWRVSNDETRDFVLGDPHASVSARATGTSANTGIIGFAAYAEQVPFTYMATAASPDVDRPRSYGGSLSASPELAPGLGMGIGQSRADHVGRTTFTRAGEPDIAEIRYDTRAALDAMGITSKGPRAFPGMTSGYERY